MLQPDIVCFSCRQLCSLQQCWRSLEGLFVDSVILYRTPADGANPMLSNECAYFGFSLSLSPQAETC